MDQHRHQRDVDHRAALQREHVHGVCRRRPARRHGEVLDRHRGEVALDLSLSHVRVQRCGDLAVLEHRERDGALSTEKLLSDGVENWLDNRSSLTDAGERRLVNQTGASWNRFPTVHSAC